MYKPLTFRDDYSSTYLSAFETLFFCATNDFIIPHDVVGAILYAEVLGEAEEVFFSKEFIEKYTLDLRSLVPDGDSYFNAIKHMGYQDIIDELDCNSQKINAFIKEKFTTEPYDTEEVVKKIESLIRPEYMAIIKKHQEITKHQKTQNETINELLLVIGLSENETYESIDLLKAKNILVAGAPEQGKSRFLESMRDSLSSKMTDVYYINLEEEIYPEREATLKIDFVYTELQSRNDMFFQSGARDIKEYNRHNPDEIMPYIVVIFDEYTILLDKPDLMKKILYLAQKGPKVGIHLIISTSHPSVNVISNKIKTLFPTRIAFKTRTAVDSRTILDVTGAEELDGYGDMLLLYKTELIQLKGCFLCLHTAL